MRFRLTPCWFTLVAFLKFAFVYALMSHHATADPIFALRVGQQAVPEKLSLITLYRQRHHQMPRYTEVMLIHLNRKLSIVCPENLIYSRN